MTDTIESLRARILELETFLSEDIAPFKDVAGFSWKHTLEDGTEVPVMRGDPDLAAFIVRLHMAGAEITQQRDDLLEALKLATHELNVIRARDGAPQHISWDRGKPLQTSGCTEEWWNELTEKCFAAIAKAEGAPVST